MWLWNRKNINIKRKTNETPIICSSVLKSPSNIQKLLKAAVSCIAPMSWEVHISSETYFFFFLMQQNMYLISFTVWKSENARNFAGIFFLWLDYNVAVLCLVVIPIYKITLNFKLEFKKRSKSIFSKMYFAWL